MLPRKKQFTTEDAARLLREGGEGNASPERVEFVRRVLEICRDEGVVFTRWNDSLARKLYFKVDVEPGRAIEEAFHLRVSESDYEATPVETFGDLARFYEDQVFVAPVRRSEQRAREKAKLDNANCATQAAFYLLRRKLCVAGVSYFQARDFGPNARNVPLTEKQARAFADALLCEYGLSLWFDRVLKNGARTGDLMTAFLFASAIGIAAVVALCTDMVSGSMIWGGFLGFAVWILLCKSFARVINHRSYLRFCKGIRNYQRLGDVAREMATAIQTPPQAQAKTS